MTNATDTDIAAALATAREMLRRALISGTSTKQIHARIAELEQRQRREAAEREAAQASADAERRRREEERDAAAAAAIVTAIEARLAARLAALAPNAAPVVRRTPAGIHLTQQDAEA